MLAVFCYGVQSIIGQGSLLRFMISCIIGLPIYYFVLFVLRVEGIRTIVDMVNSTARRIASR